MLHQTELLRLRRARYVADIPDTLYMVEDKPRTMGVDVLAAAIPGKLTRIFFSLVITQLLRTASIFIRMLKICEF